MKRCYEAIFGPGKTEPDYCRPEATWADRKAYRAAVAAVKQRYGWEKRKTVRINSMHRNGRGPIRRLPCEHCLQYGKPVMLLRPGLISRNPAGDFVCAKCDTRVAMWMLTDLVGEGE